MSNYSEFRVLRQAQQPFSVTELAEVTAKLLLVAEIEDADVADLQTLTVTAE